MRSDFRMAGLSHALAASGFHLSVLLSRRAAGGRIKTQAAAAARHRGGGSVSWPSQARKPSVVRAALMAGVGLLLLSLGARQRPIGGARPWP